MFLCRGIFTTLVFIFKHPSRTSEIEEKLPIPCCSLLFHLPACRCFRSWANIWANEPPLNEFSSRCWSKFRFLALVEYSKHRRWLSFTESYKRVPFPNEFSFSLLMLFLRLWNFFFILFCLARWEWMFEYRVALIEVRDLFVRILNSLILRRARLKDW